MRLAENVLREIIKDRQREQAGIKVRALDAIVFLTYRCTSQCKTCNIWQRGALARDELTWEQWENILVNMRDYGIKSLEIFGGDALLRKDVIFKMICFCRDNGIETYFPTNSILMDVDTSRQLVQSGLGTVYFSLDDVGEYNDKIRGVDGTFAKIKKALENLIEAKGPDNTPKIVVCTTISKMNFKHFEVIMEFLKDYPVNAVYPRVLGEFKDNDVKNSIVGGIKAEPFFMSTEEHSHRLSFDDLKTFRAIVQRIKGTGRYPYINFRAFEDTDERIAVTGEAPIKRCLMDSTVAIVNPNGDVVPCFFFKDYVLGNLLMDDFEKIWGNTAHRRFITSQQKRNIAICKNCISRIYYPGVMQTMGYFFNRLKNCIKGR